MEYIDWFGNRKKIPSEQLPINDPNEYFEKQYDLEILSINNIYSRKKLLELYKKNNKIILNDDFWFILSGSKYHFNGDGWLISSFQSYLIHNLRGEILKRLIEIEQFDPYKEAAYEKLKEIISYDKCEKITNEHNWNFYYPARPSIGEHLTKYINMKIHGNQKIVYSDYHFIFKSNGLTKFGFDHFQDILEEINNVIEMKHKNPEDLMLKQYNKFNKSGGRYLFNFSRRIKPLPQEYNEHAKISTKTVDEIFNLLNEKLLSKQQYDYDNDQSSHYENNLGVCFHKIKSLNNIISSYFRIAENSFRVKMDLPKINEGWISEMKLYNEIKKELKGINVIHHARPKFLGRQHYDIFIPSLKIAIEFQGQQHFEPVEYFGGEEAYLKNIERDERKAKISKENGVHLICVEESYSIEKIINEIESVIYKENRNCL